MSAILFCRYFSGVWPAGGSCTLLGTLATLTNQKWKYTTTDSGTNYVSLYFVKIMHVEKIQQIKTVKIAHIYIYKILKIH